MNASWKLALAAAALVGPGLASPAVAQPDAAASAAAAAAAAQDAQAAAAAVKTATTPEAAQAAADAAKAAAAAAAQAAKDAQAAADAAAAAATLAQTQAAAMAAGQDPSAPPIPPPEPSWLKGWSGGVEVGLNGSDGNSENLNFRAGVNAKRTTSKYESTARLVYTYANKDGDKTESKAQALLRNDWLIANSKWRIFGQGTFDYDEFQEWDYRISAHAGAGYQFVKTDKTSLVGRVGVGASKEFGSEADEVIPEGLLGADFGYQLTARQKLTASIDYFPSFEDPAEDYRIVARAGWEVLVDPETKMSLKIGVEDRYDSTPGDNFKSNDIDYFALLVWAF